MHQQISKLTQAALLAAGLLSIVSQSACFVDGKCRTEQECAAPETCNAEGYCVLECHSDEACELEETCTEHRCVPAVGCAGCVFEHANQTCTHGDCQMGECHVGWTDANDLTEDGCEYECEPTGPELCDEIDNDCDRRVDEDYDLPADPANCGQCGHACPEPDHTIPLCILGDCDYSCHQGWYDNNGYPEDGCEDDSCVPTGEEICDGRDNDCNGEIDEGFDKTLPESCGPQCTVCAYDQAEDLCVEGVCQMGGCEPDYYNFDDDTGTGCETYCIVQGDEVCNEQDDDCDGDSDEGIVCCPDDMVKIDDLFCIDIYEASLQDDGEGNLVAVSEAGADPYYDRNLRAEEAEDYCAAVGKRLCTASEWVMVCHGPDDTNYCYGDDYEPTTCNGIDAFGPGGHHPVPTGSFDLCVNEYEIYDINGNVWELTADGLVRGGAYNCVDSARLHDCSFSIDPSHVLAIGFRCCR